MMARKRLLNYTLYYSLLLNSPLIFMKSGHIYCEIYWSTHALKIFNITISSRPLWNFYERSNPDFCLLCYAAAAKSLQSCPTLCDPTDGSHQAPPFLGFSRQEHWSRLPFPSPIQESEKWKWSHSVVSDSSWPHGLQPTRLLHPWDFPGKSTGVGCHCLLRNIYETVLKNKHNIHDMDKSWQVIWLQF